MLIAGIDLGTTHCALAFTDPSSGANAAIHDVPLLQGIRPHEVGTRRLLPSAVYQPGPHDFPTGALTLPWSASPAQAVGEIARWQGMQIPGRLITSAKSWLCHPNVDRQAPILPWGAGADVAKLSPVQASAMLLQHLAKSFLHAHPQAPLEDQEVVITVPASFDEVARSLTVSAARAAGFERFTLLEEPLAALYDFTAHHRHDLSTALQNVRLVLVVDVGGGTTDFTLVQVEALPEGPTLKRVAVGDHLMLGGDNMDAALAHLLEQSHTEQGKKLSATQWTQLVHAVRGAKEKLLGANPLDNQTVTITGTGSRLLGNTLTFELLRQQVEERVIEGFFPKVAPDEVPHAKNRMAIQELGLPYTQDPAITRHLVSFLRQHARPGFQALGQEPTHTLPRPDAVLLNGGVFNSPVLTRRLVDALSALWPDRPPLKLLHHESLDLAVARGAAYYGLIRRGLGRRIGGGAARAYYVGLEKTSAANPPSPGLCLIPRGFEEGESVKLGTQTFSLTLGTPVAFQLFSTSADRIDKPGDLVSLSDESFRPLPPIHTVLRSTQGKTGELPVHLEASLTEIGTLELWCVSTPTDERWRLEFELRGQSATQIAVTESMPARYAEAKEHLQRVYGHKPLPVGPKDVKQLGKTLEKTLGPRETWRLPVLRELWSALFGGASKRRRSADHERVFFQLTGFCLRPGFGYPLDEWRAEQTFGLFKDLIQFHTEKPNWNEYWVMWRRLSGGLSPASQQSLWAYLQPQLERKLGVAAPTKERARGIQPEGTDEMVRCAASLEHLEPADKVMLGDWAAQKLQEPATTGGPWSWALGRIGARVPLYGSAHRVVPAEDAARWLTWLLEVGLQKVDGAPFAAAQLARRTGDRTRDLPDALRAECVRALKAARASEHWIQSVEDVTQLNAVDEARALGDTLPAGLKLQR